MNMYGLQSAGYISARIGLLAIAFVPLGILLAMTPPAAAQSELSWQYHRNLHQDPFQTSLMLVYGVPETDDIRFRAQCLIGNSGTYATIDIGAEIGTLAEQATVEVQFVGQGFNHVVTGTVSRPENEGIHGVSIPLQLDDPLWDAISGQSVLHYNVTGFTAAKLPLGGSKGPTTRFLEDCREMPGPDTAAAPATPRSRPIPAGPPAMSCVTSAPANRTCR